MKTAIIILSDPKTGGDEAFGRAFNGLAAAYDYKQKGDDVTILFQGTGTRWPAELSKSKNPAHELFQAVKDKIAGVSCGCADAFATGQRAGDFLRGSRRHSRQRR